MNRVQQKAEPDVAASQCLRMKTAVAVQCLLMDNAVMNIIRIL